jgi:subtilase family serine protease
MIALLATLIAANATPVCTGADVAITNVTVSHASNGKLMNYTLSITVKNVGSVNQRANVLDNVSEVLDGEKKGEKGLPPLAAGASYTFPYVVQRALDAAPGSTTVRLHIVSDQVPGSPGDCSILNESRQVRF